ncbi:MAG: hypothetical protein M3Y42_02560 [Actinomycetota bacterium]|nr:hypothetical protein [Actinomycetota bacterium]MDQ2955828.1 hypothetical protein [Actinomycetota bacterium]
MAAWALIALGAARRYGTYTPLAIALVSAGMLLLSIGVLLLGSGRFRLPNRTSLVLGCLVAVGSTIASPAERYAHGPAERWSHGLLIAAAICLIALACLPKLLRWLQAAIVMLAAAAGVAGIRATPRPTIDDWHILQGSARALVHLDNIYGQAWPGAEGHLLPYLPGSAVLLTPFYLAFSDVRYGLLAAMVLAALAVAGLHRSARSQAIAVLSGLILIYPWVLYGVEQSWPEPLLLALIAGMVLAVETKHPVLAVLCFTAALVTKQHIVILLPFAAIWPAFGWRRTVTSVAAAVVVTLPWVIAGPRNFWHGAVTYNLNLPPRHDSLSVFTTAIREGRTPSFALVPLVMLIALVLGLWKLPRTTAGFVLGSAWLLGVFDLVNKQSFFNEWSLVVGLIVLGMATLALADSPDTR